jgi:DNA-binding CsgD family transcriptional regulator/N-acetylneuraminic acid mutarotase
MSEELIPLSDREMEIVRLLATGATNQQIARELAISVNTVKVHLRNIYAKLGVASRTEATMVAVRQGWVQVPRTSAEIGGEVALEGAKGAPPSSAWPSLERWPRVSVAKRVGLLAAIMLAVLSLFLPQTLQGNANGEETDVIGGVFPTRAAGPAGSRWRSHAQMPTPRTDLALVAHEGLIYAIGGVSNEGVTAKVEVYDPQLDTWSTRRSKPTPVGFVSAADVEGRIYVPGGIGAGVQPQDVLEVYDPARDVWETRAPMPEPLGAYGLAALDGQLYLFGGRGQQGYVASVYRYDVHADRWEALDPMDQARGLLGAAALGDRIYVIGGYDGVNEFNTCEAYDPATGTWTPQIPMALRRGGLGMVAFRERLYVIGGGLTTYLAFNERYDPRVGVWDRIETPITGLWRGLGAAAVGPYIYAIGGWNESFLSVNEAYQALFQVTFP